MTLAELRDNLEARGLLAAAEAIARDHHVTVDEMLGRLRTPHVHRARVAFVFALKARGLSSTAIGRLVDRDHTSVLSMLGSKRRRAA